MTYLTMLSFLNQACTSHRLVCTWFLKIVSVQTSVCVCVYSVCVFVCVCACVRACVCVPSRLLITSGMMWHYMDHIRLIKQVLQLLYGNCSRYREWAWP